jgi:hypothetical protein
MRFALHCGFLLLALVAVSCAKELPEAPSSVASPHGINGMAEPASPIIAVPVKLVPPSEPDGPLIDKKFLALAIVSTGSTFADSYTTLFARQNWLAGKQGVCNIEVESPYLYGTHPTVIRTYAVASMKSAGSALAAYYLRRHHIRLWSMPLVANAIMSLQGVGQNMANCN